MASDSNKVVMFYDIHKTIELLNEDEQFDDIKKLLFFLKTLVLLLCLHNVL